MKAVFKYDAEKTFSEQESAKQAPIDGTIDDELYSRHNIKLNYRDFIEYASRKRTLNTNKVC